MFYQFSLELNTEMQNRLANHFKLWFIVLMKLEVNLHENNKLLLIYFVIYGRPKEFKQWIFKIYVWFGLINETSCILISGFKNHIMDNTIYVYVKNSKKHLFCFTILKYNIFILTFFFAQWIFLYYHYYF